MTYKLTGYNGEEMQGSFYEQELQKTKQDIFRIEKKIKQQGKKSLVKWLGYRDSFNLWVDNKATNKLWSHNLKCSLPRVLAFTNFPEVRPLYHSSLVPRQWLDSQFSPRLYRTTVSQFKHN